MEIGVNVPNFGPGTDPGVLRDWAQTVEGLGFDQRGRLTDDHLRAVRAAWQNDDDYRCGPIPIWVGGNSDAGMRRAVLLGDARHPLRNTLPWLREARDRLGTLADRERRPVPGLAPRIALRLTATPVTGSERLAGEGTIEQVIEDLNELRGLGAGTVLLDPCNGDPRETCRPREAWRALASVAAALDQRERADARGGL